MARVIVFNAGCKGACFRSTRSQLKLKGARVCSLSSFAGVVLSHSCKQGFKGKRSELVFCPVLEEKETVALQDMSN